MKKTYIQPTVEVFMTVTQYQLLAGSGPGAGDQIDPGLGGGGARELFDFEDAGDDQLNELIKLMQ